MNISTYILSLIPLGFINKLYFTVERWIDNVHNAHRVREYSKMCKATKQMEEFLNNNPHLEKELLNQRHVGTLIDLDTLYPNPNPISLNDLRTNNHDSASL